MSVARGRGHVAGEDPLFASSNFEKKMSSSQRPVQFHPGLSGNKVVPFDFPSQRRPQVFRIDRREGRGLDFLIVVSRRSVGVA